MLMHHRQVAPSAWFSGIFIALGSIFVLGTLFWLFQQNQMLKNALAKQQLRGQSSLFAVGAVLPSVSLVDLDGEDKELGELLPEGGVIGYFTTTCPFCEQNLPQWNRLQEELAAIDVPVVGVSLHSAERTKAYFENRPVAWPSLAVGTRRAALELGVRAVPLSILVDSDNQVRAIWNGVLSADDIREIRVLAETLNTGPS